VHADTICTQGGHLRTITSSATSLEPVRTYGRSIFTSAAIMVKLPAAIMASHRGKFSHRDWNPGFSLTPGADDLND